MSKKWVDGAGYFGPNRRNRRSEKRLIGERRRTDESGERPSVAALLRRARVLLLSVRTNADREQALRYLETAWIACETEGPKGRADLLKQASRKLASARLHDKHDMSQVEEMIAQAMVEG